MLKKSLPIEKEVTEIDKNGNETIETILQNKNY